MPSAQPAATLRPHGFQVSPQRLQAYRSRCPGTPGGQVHTLNSRGFVVCDRILQAVPWFFFMVVLVFFPVCFSMWTAESAFLAPGLRDGGPVGTLIRVQLHL